MTIVVLTDELRSLPFFEKIEEKEIIVPDLPFVHELLFNSFSLENKSILDLERALYTAVYFNLDTKGIAKELVWKIGEKEENVDYFLLWDEKEELYSWKEFKVNLDCKDYSNEGAAFVIKMILEKEIGKRINKVQACIRYETLEMKEIAKFGNLKLMKYTHENCLKYTHENDCSWDDWICCYAAKYGHLDCLKYAHENDCPWDEDTCNYFGCSGNSNCIKYAQKNGCPDRHTYYKD